MNQRLANLAGRLATLILELPRIGPLLDLAAGALASLLKAQAMDYRGRDEDEELPPAYYVKLSERVKRMASGTLPPKGRWISGYYFNSALMRLGAAREQTRGLLAFLDKRCKQRGKMPTLKSTEIDHVHREVNTLKHSLQGLHGGRLVTFWQAVEAMEELVSVLELRQPQLADPQTRLPGMKIQPRRKRCL